MAKNVFGLALLLSAGVGFGCLPRAAVAAPSICDAIPGNLIVNCGFEARTGLGWTQSGNTSFTFIATPGLLDGLLSNPNSGDRFAALGPVGSEGYLSQTFNDTAAQQLQLEFFLANNSGTPNTFHVSFNDDLLLSLSNDGAHSFTDYVFVVMATGLDTLLIGGFRHDFGLFGLDDISVVPVPEPGSFWLLAIGLTGLGMGLGCRLAMRQRRPRCRWLSAAATDIADECRRRVGASLLISFDNWRA
jgi:hypothetical protein